MPTIFQSGEGESQPDTPPEKPARRRFRSYRLEVLQGRPMRVASRVVVLVLLALAALFGSLAGLMLVYSTDLPQIEDLEHYRPSTTTELYDVHGRIFGSFALQRRVVITYNDFPPMLRQAVISIEDKSFESNWGVNVVRVIGAAYRNLTSPARATGASTITMQLARNLFLSAERTFGRKVQEVFLSIQIERHFTKKQIFTLYGNQIYLGHGVYGFEAGAQYYFSKHARDLTLPEAALLAALPKGPEYYSPIRTPGRAFKRRNLVLNAMLEDGAITAEQAAAAKAAPLGLRIEPPPNSVAPWFVEEVRRQLEKQYGAEQVHEAGLRVYTTLNLDLQQVANRAVLDGVASYERRKGWSGHLINIVMSGSDLESFRHPDWALPVQPGAYVHALVTQVSPDHVVVRAGQNQITLTQEDWKWTGNRTADLFLKTGDVVYVRITEVKAAGGGLRAALEQDSGAEAALLSVDNSTGEVLAMVGGRDFNLSQFDRATQAERQTGSSFKPYVYTTAVEAGAKPEDTIVDGPTTFMTASGPYTPHDYEGNYLGTISLLTAFADSRNIPALKLAERVGIHKVIETAHRFGVTENIPAYLPVAIGSAEVTLFEQVAAYSVFPNDGIRIEPHYIRRVTSADGLLLDEPAADVKEVISTQTARTMMVFLQEVTHSGTGAAAAQLKHPLGGKTGTTNDYTDAWFLGFSPSITTGTWIGYDERQSLGEKETGARAALPMWMDFMRVAITSHPAEKFANGPLPPSQAQAVASPNAADVGKATAVTPNTRTKAPAAAAAKSPPIEQKQAPKKEPETVYGPYVPYKPKLTTGGTAASPSPAPAGSSSAPAPHPAGSAPAKPR